MAPVPAPLLLAVLLCAAGTRAQQPVTAADYARAESLLGASVAPLVDGVISRQAWLDDGRLLYRNAVAGGHEFVVADPVARVQVPAFDHDRLARSLSRVSGAELAPRQLPLSDLRFAADRGSISFAVRGRSYRCDLSSYACKAEDGGDRREGVLSPDGSHLAFLRDHDLWVRAVATGHETRLTTGGTGDFGYGTNNAGWIRGDGPVLKWSPDSKRIATFQHDGRGVGDMYLVSTRVGRPELQRWKYPLPGDEHIFRIHRVVVHLDGPRVVRLKMPPDAHRSTTTDHVAGRDGEFLDVAWRGKGAELAFVSSSRDHKTAWLRVADPETGAVRDVLSETVPTYYESGSGDPNWRVLEDTGEVIWFSERSDWGHLYLYDLATGKLKRPITKGDWAVQQVLRVDEQERRVYFTAAGREPGDPYFHYLYRAPLDGGEPQLLTPEPAHHSVSIAPSGRFLVDSFSTPVQPPVAVLRGMDGTVVLLLQRADISRLVAAGWRPPVPFTTKARDGKTDLHGLMYRPTRFDRSRRYPILNYLYPGPQSGSVGSRSFQAARRDKQAVAELGFVVVEVDAMGTPGRSKSFHDAYYGNMGDNGIPDQIATIQELAAAHPFLDLTRVGIWGHSGGGFASTRAILQYPDFYKVAVSSAGNHDNRNYEDDWAEKWQGLLRADPNGGTSYDNQANQLLAKNLRGKLLLAHGTMDSNVPPSNTLLVVDALIAANKDFDLLLFPNRRHGFGNEPYMMRRRWDYFVRHLLGVEPPKEYRFRTDTNRRQP